jgi:hypothetical protein
MFFVKSSIVISSLCTILLLLEDSEVEEAEMEVVLWKTKSIERKDKLGNRLQVIYIYPKKSSRLLGYSKITILD